MLTAGSFEFRLEAAVRDQQQLPLQGGTQNVV